MDTNQLPRYDTSVNTTGCCCKFNPEGWDGQELHFAAKPFVRARTRSLLHVPLDVGKVFSRVTEHLKQAGALRENGYIVLSRDLSAMRSEHLFAVPHAIPEEEMTTLSGDFFTRVFEGPYRQAGAWKHEMEEAVRRRGHEPGDVYFFYTTCPRCAKAYGENYVVALAEEKLPAA